jgi:1,4-alpha-glucan branching enzyme
MNPPPDRDRGELAIVLHSHMPYVEGFGVWPFGEEWLLEAIASSYLPLIGLFERWAQDGSDAVVTVGITPVLADQLAVPDVGERFLNFMRGTRAECHRLDIDGLQRDGQTGAAAALRESARDYELAGTEFERLGGDLIGALGRLQEAGTVELWASSATHAVLPLLETEAGVQLQVRTGVSSHRDRFGGWDGGFWLPECAYRPGIEEQLARAGARCFCIDQTRTGDDLDQLEPVATRSGAVAVPIDWRTVTRVWDERGYPADVTYRDYHSQTINGMRPWCNGGAPYDREAAFTLARRHAREFVESVAARLDRYRSERDRPGLCVCALDTELLGHWWFEGPIWLEAVAGEARAAGVALASLPAALDRYGPVERDLVESSWGASKDLSTWDSRAVSALRWPAATSELELVGALRSPPDPGPAREAALRAARELLALQSSDWAFMEARRLAGDYPLARVSEHRRLFSQALAELERGMQDSLGMAGGTDTVATLGAASLDPALRGLAPGVELSPLLEPCSPWGRA